MFGPSLDTLACNPVSGSTGIVPRICEALLAGKAWLATIGISVHFSAQFVEIYNEKVTDLLTGELATVRRDTGDLVGATERAFTSMNEVMELVDVGNARKRFAATAMNDRSSRSHSALVIEVIQSNSKNILIKSHIHLVDLAGSERVKKSNVQGTNLKEAVGINSSLLVLGKVISSLVECKTHVPYLESKLTTLLRCAFGGNSRTLAIINCRSDDCHGDETLQSLRFGESCSRITNTLKTLASSASDALQLVTCTLSKVLVQLETLESRGKKDLPSYHKLKGSYLALLRKKDNLAVKETASCVSNCRSLVS